MSYKYSGCKGLTSITIPNSVSTIGDYAFDRCYGLTSINIPNSVTSIGNGAFLNCSGLTSISIPNSVTSIGDAAFRYCFRLTSVTIPSSVDSIGIGAFRDCIAIDTLFLGWTDPTTCTFGEDMLTNVPTTATLYVPAGTKSLYQATAPWSSFRFIVEYELTGIQQHTLQADNPISAYYNTSGQRIKEPQKGQVVVVRYTDGTTRKVLVK